MSNLRITEIFYSLQGESTTVGLPTVFVRLTGCPLRCSYCDTAYAFSGGQWQTLEEIIGKVASFKPRYVTVTGGEPLAQPNCLPLLTELCNEDYSVSLETSGALDVSGVDPRVIKVMDLKTPSSNEISKNRYENLDYLTQQDQIKFVIGNEEDYRWSCAMLEKYALADRCHILFSPSYGVQEIQDLAEWILRDNLPVRLQIQLHKYIWGEKPGC